MATLPMVNRNSSHCLFSHSRNSRNKASVWGLETSVWGFRTAALRLLSLATIVSHLIVCLFKFESNIGGAHRVDAGNKYRHDEGRHSDAAHGDIL